MCSVRRAVCDARTREEKREGEKQSVQMGVGARTPWLSAVRTDLPECVPLYGRSAVACVARMAVLRFLIFLEHSAVPV